MSGAYLLDTHMLLWCLSDPAQLPQPVHAAIVNPASSLWVSAVSAWEISTKYRLGKLPQAEGLLQHYPQYLKRLQADELPITSAHALQTARFSSPHRDPFDRMLAAQSHCEGLTLISKDPVFKAFEIPLLWA